jgi:hypothetical protein
MTMRAQLDLKMIDGDEARVEPFMVALKGEHSRCPTADDTTAATSRGWLTEGFTASGKMQGKRPQ